MRSARRNSSTLPLHSRRRCAIPYFLFACVAIATFAGCRPEPNQLEILSFRKPEQQESFVEQFPNGYFRVNNERTYEIVMELEPKLLEVHGETAGGDEKGESNRPPDLVWTSQLIHIQLLWQALPGKTYAESTQTNASIVYCLVTGKNAISYEGAGFVFFELSRDGETLEGRIESASLRPTRFAGEPVDLFGACRVTGKFEARVGHREVASVRQRLRRLLGKPSEGFVGP